MPNYLKGEIPENYVCQTCGARGSKLWRFSSSFDIGLQCCECAAILENEDISTINDEGQYGKDMCDQIGSYVPAIPIEYIEKGYWSYGSAPNNAVEWWYALPTRPKKKSRKIDWKK